MSSNCAETPSIGQNYAKFLQSLIEKGKNTHAVYTEYADKYDKYISEFLWSTSDLFAESFSKLEPNTGVQILDVACGSGRLGKSLTTLGYKYIDGLDGCRPFFEKALERGIPYRKIVECYVKEDVKIPVEKGTYDAALLCDAVYKDHITPSQFKPIMQVLKPGGLLGWSRLYCSTQPYDYVNLAPEDYENVLLSLEKSGVIKPIEGWYPKIVKELPGVMRQEISFVKVA